MISLVNAYAGVQERPKNYIENYVNNDVISSPSAKKPLRCHLLDLLHNTRFGFWALFIVFKGP